MEIQELYQQMRGEGRSTGHAQWCVGNRLLTGREVEKDLDKAEEWFLRAWDHHFPGTATTQTFLLKRQWDRFIAERYPEAPRMQTLLSDAKVSSDERHGTILIPVHNDAQAAWLQGRIEGLLEAFLPTTGGRFEEITLTLEKQSDNL